MASTPHKQKLYCYVDETGQDTHGRLFLVAVVIAGEKRAELAPALDRIEEITGKRLSKWRKAAFDRKAAYMRAILSSPHFAGALFFARYLETKAYLDLMVLATARAILLKAKEPYKATVIVDGLSDAEVRRFAHGLRALHVSVRKVRGMEDERDPFIRLADALAGFVRDYIEGQPYATKIYNEFDGKRMLREIR
jgi:hypothetical protein